VLALRLSFVGELGWELYPTADTAAALYHAILAAGASCGLRHAGHHALDSLRCEKGYLHWPFDACPTDTPFETGLGFTVAWDKCPFDGSEALRKLKAPRTGAPGLMHLRLVEPKPLLRHGERVL
jgi:glycine cleavage system aminomethyltransferase T